MKTEEKCPDLKSLFHDVFRSRREILSNVEESHVQGCGVCQQVRNHLVELMMESTHNVRTLSPAYIDALFEGNEDALKKLVERLREEEERSD